MGGFVTRSPKVTKLGTGHRPGTEATGHRRFLCDVSPSEAAREIGREEWRAMASALPLLNSLPVFPPPGNRRSFMRRRTPCGTRCFNSPPPPPPPRAQHPPCKRLGFTHESSPHPLPSPSLPLPFPRPNGESHSHASPAWRHGAGTAPCPAPPAARPAPPPAPPRFDERNSAENPPIYHSPREGNSANGTSKST